MESAVSDQPQSKVSQFFRSLGPGILMASAARRWFSPCCIHQSRGDLRLATRGAHPAGKPF